MRQHVGAALLMVVASTILMPGCATPDATARPGEPAADCAAMANQGNGGAPQRCRNMAAECNCQEM